MVRVDGTEVQSEAANRPDVAIGNFTHIAAVLKRPLETKVTDRLPSGQTTGHSYRRAHAACSRTKAALLLSCLPRGITADHAFRRADVPFQGSFQPEQCIVRDSRCFRKCAQVALYLIAKGYQGSPAQCATC